MFGKRKLKKEDERKEEPKAEVGGATGEAEADRVDSGSAEDKSKGESGETSAAPDAAVPPADEKKPEAGAEPDWKTLYARTLADFDNYKKRAARDREDTYRYAEADILKDVLPAVDNLQLALANAGEKSGDDPFVKGVRLVYETLLSSLKEHGAVPFDSVGEALDTERMEAIATFPSADIEEGKVSIESKKGWMLRDKVLRAAQVVVSSGTPAAAAGEAKEEKKV